MLCIRCDCLLLAVAIASYRYMARQVALLLPVLAIVCLIECTLLLLAGTTYGGVLEIDVSIMSILISLPSVIS